MQGNGRPSEHGGPPGTYSEAAMRWLYIVLIVLFAAATLLFLIQNREIVSMDFLGFSVRIPLAVMAATFYTFGATTGSSAFALVRKAIREASSKPTAHS